jgi:hypothetical protein
MNLLKQIQIEYEHFPNIEAKNSYKQNVAVISQKLRQCEANLSNFIKDSLPQDANSLFDHFSI